MFLEYPYLLIYGCLPKTWTNIATTMLTVDCDESFLHMKSSDTYCFEFAFIFKVALVRLDQSSFPEELSHDKLTQNWIESPIVLQPPLVY